MENKKSDFWPEMARPFVVLVVICLVAAALLGAVNNLTAPVIAENTRLAAEQTRKEVLPAATGFKELPVSEELAKLGVTGIFEDEGGNGYVVSAANKGYGGDVTVTVGFDPDGVIGNIKVDVSSETKGVGSKLAGQEYADKFIGLSGDASGIELRTGATFTSNAYRSSVNAAFAAVQSVK